VSAYRGILLVGLDRTEHHVHCDDTADELMSE